MITKPENLVFSPGLSFVTARFWKKFHILVARSFGVGAGVQDFISNSQVAIGNLATARCDCVQTTFENRIGAKRAQVVISIIVSLSLTRCATSVFE